MASQMPYADIEKYREYQRNYQRKLRAENPEWAREQSRKTHNKHRGKRLAYARDYKKKNRAQMTALQRKRHCAKLQRTPKWANSKAIASIYALAAQMSLLTGIRHEVDHVLPLQGKAVSGLHVEKNLRIVPWRENRSKGNRVG